MLDFLGQFEAVGANWNKNLVEPNKQAFSSSTPVMEYSSSAFVDTSLDLNSKPLRLVDDAPVCAYQKLFDWLFREKSFWFLFFLGGL